MLLKSSVNYRRGKRRLGNRSEIGNRYLSFVIKVAVYHVSPVVQVGFVGGRTYCDGFLSSLIMGSSFISSGFGDASFRMCHFKLTN